MVVEMAFCKLNAGNAGTSAHYAPGFAVCDAGAYYTDIDHYAFVLESEACDTVRLLAEGWGWTEGLKGPDPR